MEKIFTDTEGEVISFSGSSPNIKVISRDVGLSTAEILLENQESQLVVQQHAEVQSCEQITEAKSEYDEAALLDFMRRFAPKVEAELRKSNRHFNVNFQQSQSDVDDVATRRVGVLPKPSKIEKMKSKQIRWSCYGDKIAISFGFMKHEFWCEHSSFVLIYESDKNDEFKSEAKEFIETSTCIVDMKFHPTINSILVFATEEGRIYSHSTVDNIENNSRNYIQCKNMGITQLSWVELNSSYYLAVADSEGFLTLWNTSPFVKDWNVWSSFSLKSLGGANNRAILCFDFSINPEHFVVAAEGGRLLQCSFISSLAVDNQAYDPVVSDFECSFAIIDSVEFSKFDESVFAVSLNNQYLKVYHLNEKAPKSTIALEHSPLGLQWSYLQDDILLVWFSHGEIQYYNYRNCCLVKSSTLEDTIQSLSFKIRGMKLLCVAVSTHNVATIWQTGLFVK